MWYTNFILGYRENTHTNHKIQEKITLLWFLIYENFGVVLSYQQAKHYTHQAYKYYKN